MAKNIVVKLSVEPFCLHQVKLVHADIRSVSLRVQNIKFTFAAARACSIEGGGGGKETRQNVQNVQIRSPFCWLLRCVVAAPESPGNGFWSSLRAADPVTHRNAITLQRSSRKLKKANFT